MTDPTKYVPQPIDTSDVTLPDSEKAFDRNTAFETLKLITKFGFTIEKK